VGCQIWESVVRVHNCRCCCASKATRSSQSNVTIPRLFALDELEYTDRRRFSRRSILSLEHLIQQRTELLCKRIAEFKVTKQPLPMTEMLPAFTGDIIMQYSFGFSYNQLESPAFDSFHEAFMAIGSSAHVASFFPWLIAVSLIHPYMPSVKYAYF
jgi:Cytochrome P450